MDASLKKEFDFYLKNQQDLANEHEGKVVVIKDEKVLGFFDSALQATIETKKTHDLGTFLVQTVTKDDSGYTATFHSRVAFN